MHSDSRGTRVIILHNAATWFFSLPPPPPPSPGQRGGATLRETYACKLITLGYLCIPLRAIIIAPRFMKVRAGETATRFALRTANNLRDGVSRVSRQEYSSPPPYSRNRFSDKSLSLSVFLSLETVCSFPILLNTRHARLKARWKGEDDGNCFDRVPSWKVASSASSCACVCSELQQPHKHRSNAKPFRDRSRETRRPLFAAVRPYWRLATSQQIFSAISSPFPPRPDQTHIAPVSQL